MAFESFVANVLNTYGQQLPRETGNKAEERTVTRPKQSYWSTEVMCDMVNGCTQAGDGLLQALQEPHEA